MNARKITQVIPAPHGIVALCDDGSIWYKKISPDAIIGVRTQIGAIPSD
jgi:hypothetical protein